jgi:metal-responsive CopG/Arc/MetJ family transcriptional regulator
MKPISVKLPEALLERANRLSEKRKIPRNQLFVLALEQYLHEDDVNELRERFRLESLAVRGNSIHVLKEFEPLDMEALAKLL